MCSKKSKLLNVERQVDKDGNVEWGIFSKNGVKYHRENGPALELVSGTTMWYYNNKLHRENGPALEFCDGKKYWYFYGKLHRIDGPAVEKPYKKYHWFLKDKEYYSIERFCNAAGITEDEKTLFLLKWA